jgi:hypothetical protein
VIKINQKSLKEFLQMINENKKFSFTRYWDGELSCIMGRAGKNCDGCTYLPELQTGLIKTLTEPKNYYHALNMPENHKGTTNLRKSFEEFLIKINCNIEWYDFMLFQRATISGTFFPVVSLFKQKKITIIGGKHLEALTRLFPESKFIETYRIDAILQKEKIKQEILQDYNNTIFIVCVGMASNVIINELYNSIGNECWMLDMGSVWDILLGMPSRSWHRNLDKNIIKRNLFGG